MIHNLLQVDNDKLKEGFDAEKKTNTALHADNDKLKQDFDAEKKTNTALQADNDNMHKDLKTYRETVKSLETNTKTLRKELETSKAGLRYLADPILVHTIKPTNETAYEKRDIRGLTILDKELFVVSVINTSIKKSSEVEVYDSIDFSFSRGWNLKELYDAGDMVSCNINKCLYIFDLKKRNQSKEILRVDPNGILKKNWLTNVPVVPASTFLNITFGSKRENDDYGLSVTEQLNVILNHEHKLSEYEPDGQLIRTINLSLRCGPIHAIKLTNGHFVVSFSRESDGHDGVCIVDADGKLEKSFNGTKYPIELMSNSSHLTVDGNGFVMVVDRGSSRVLLLDSDLKLKREILSHQKHGMLKPRKIFLDESNDRLFMVNNELNNEQLVYNQWILIFNLK